MKLKIFAYPAAAFLGLAAAPTASHAIAVVPNFNVGAAVPTGGFPHFENDNSIALTLTKSGSGAGATYQMTANYTTGPFVFQYNPWVSFNVNGTYQLQGSFNSSGTFTGGTVTINGTIPGYNIPGTTAPPVASSLLYRANLTAFGYDTVNDATPAALGFKTESPTGWAAQFQGGPESIYLYEFNTAAFMNSFTSAKFKSVQFTKASAITTVPLPAALWLFGSAVAALAGTRRRAAASC